MSKENDSNLSRMTDALVALAEDARTLVNNCNALILLELEPKRNKAARKAEREAKKAERGK